MKILKSHFDRLLEVAGARYKEKRVGAAQDLEFLVQLSDQVDAADGPWVEVPERVGEIAEWCGVRLHRGSEPSECRAFWRDLLRAMSGPSDATPEEKSLMRRLRDLAPAKKTALTTGLDPGAAMVPTLASEQLVELALASGAYRDLNVISLSTGRSVIPVMTALPGGVFRQPLSQGTQVPADEALTGEGVSVEANELVTLVPVAIGVIEDARVDFGTWLPQQLAQGLAARIDHAAFAADGDDDGTDGGQTGIFAHDEVPVVEAGTAQSTAEIEREDLLRVLDAVAPAALQRGCRWFVHPSIYRKLLRVTDGAGAPVVQFGAGGELRILGAPVSLVSAAPSTDAAGEIVLAFGCGQGYAVAMRDDFVVSWSASGPGFDKHLSYLKCATRVRCEMLNPDYFALLRLKAS